MIRGPFMGVVLGQGSLEGLSCSLLGNEVEFFDEIGSTNELAMERAENGCSEGLVIVARKQNRGRGRRGRSFVSPEGGLYISVVLRPDLPSSGISMIPLMSGLAVSKAISATVQVPTALKWPNDVQIDGRKVCGILVESSVKSDRTEYIVVGIGLNVNFSLNELPVGVRSRSSTLMEVTGYEVDLADMLRNLLYSLDMLYLRFLAGDTLSILEQWSDRSETIGRKVRVTSPGGVIIGKALGVDQTGALMITSDDGSLQRVEMGDLEHLDHTE